MMFLLSSKQKPEVRIQNAEHSETANCQLFSCFSCSRNDSENLVLAHDDEFVAVELDLAARILAEQDAVAGLYVE